jgi:hypothetical protein
MIAKQFYIRQAELCIRLSEETLDGTIAERLRSVAADFFERAHDTGSDDMTLLAPDIIVDSDAGRD